MDKRCSNKICSIEGCGKPKLAKGYCNTHWIRNHKYGDPHKLVIRFNCSVEGCTRPHNGKGFCAFHLAREKRKSGYSAAQFRTPKYRFGYAKRNCKKRNLVWELNLEQYTILIQQNCHYCFGELNSGGIALDRKDNDIGYTLENVVPCCKYCNHIRSDAFTYEEFLEFSKTDLFRRILERSHVKILAQLRKRYGENYDPKTGLGTRIQES